MQFIEFDFADSDLSLLRAFILLVVLHSGSSLLLGQLDYFLC